MFFPGSRYQNTGSYTVTTTTGVIVTVAAAPQPLPNRILGFHPRLDGQRLDLIANNYLGDPTTFWRLCDSNDAMAPDALGMQPLVGIPSTAIG